MRKTRRSSKSWVLSVVLDKTLTGQRESEVEARIAAAGFVEVELSVKRAFAFGAVASCRARAPGHSGAG